MRKLFLISLLCCAGTFTADAQFYKEYIPSPAFTDSLNDIVRDFKNNFKNIQGDPVNLLENVDVFASKKSLPGASRAFVYRYHSADDSSASFQAIMYEGEDFEKASKIYKNNFRMLRKTRLKMEAFSTGFEGTMNEPNEETGFTISQLHATSNSLMFTDFMVEVELIYEMYEWKVRLNFQKKRPDNVF